MYTSFPFGLLYIACHAAKSSVKQSWFVFLPLRNCPQKWLQTHQSRLPWRVSDDAIFPVRQIRATTRIHAQLRNVKTTDNLGQEATRTSRRYSKDLSHRDLYGFFLVTLIWLGSEKWAGRTLLRGQALRVWLFFTHVIHGHSQACLERVRTKEVFAYYRAVSVSHLYCVTTLRTALTRRNRNASCRVFCMGQPSAELCRIVVTYLSRERHRHKSMPRALWYPKHKEAAGLLRFNNTPDHCMPLGRNCTVYILYAETFRLSNLTLSQI